MAIEEPRVPGAGCARLGTRIAGWLHAPIDAASLVVFRVCFGLLMLIGVLRFLAKGWIHEYFLAPQFFFTYLGFEWVVPWPPLVMYAHFALMALCALLIAVGAVYRQSCLVFGLLFTYAHLIDKSHYLNHYYLISCLSLLLACLPLGRRFSIDALRAARRARPLVRSDMLPAWALYALRFQIGLVYAFGGIAKLKPDFLVHAQPLKVWLAASTDLPVLGGFFALPWAPHAMSYAGAGFDLGVVPLLLWRRTRPLAYLAVVVFHGVTALWFQLGIFPWLMLVSSLVFLDPSFPRQFLARVRGEGAPRLTAAGGANLATEPRLSKLAYAAFAGYALLQLGLPFRHLLYPGEVCWTEQGFRFSWNVMLMEKNGSVDFQVVDPGSGRSFWVNPRATLTPYQAKMMETQPDMILQFAHYLAHEFEKKGVRQPRVFAHAFASLNGRPAQPLIDPAIDLALERDGFRTKPWIMALAPRSSASTAPALASTR